MSDTQSNAEDIISRFTALKTENPKLRARDAARSLGISEGELLAAQTGPSVIRLRPDFVEILQAVEKLGTVMALTRNEYCVHERHGVYENLQVFGEKGARHVLMINPDIDLRIMIGAWRHAFAVLQQGDSGPRSSLQFFDAGGNAIHKIYLTAVSDSDAFAPLVTSFRDNDQSAGLSPEDVSAPAPVKRDDEVNWVKFRAAWEEMTDVHQFFGLLRKFRVSRLQAHRHIGRDFAVPVALDSARRALELAAESNFEIMVFVGNRGMVQIHTGTVSVLKEFGPWFNVLDSKFNLHLNEEGIHQAWIVRKPTKDGLVSSLEIFDADGQIVVTFFGRRMEGNPEQAAWREILSRLTEKEAADAA
jgi:putative hemin transport protein